MPYLYGFEYYLSYYLFMLPGLILALIANASVKSTFRKYSQVSNRRMMTGRDAAEAVLRYAGVNNVRIEHVSGDLTDHYDPKQNVIRLSNSVYDSSSVAAVGVAAHEAGHAVQYATHYAPIKMRAAVLPICNFGGQISVPLILIGSVMAFDALVYAGLILFSFVVLFRLITLPVEFNASRRALKNISEYGLLDQSEYSSAKKVLTAAAMTYVASFLQTVLMLIYYILRSSGRRNR